MGMRALIRVMGNIGERGDEKLQTWQQIAGYLGVSVRTAQAWAKERGLPYHRMPGQRTQVFAYPAELDAWRAASETPAAPTVDNPLPAPNATRHRLWYLGLFAAVIGVGFLAFLKYSTPRRELTSYAIRGRVVDLLDEQGALIRSVTLPYRPFPLDPQHHALPLVFAPNGQGPRRLLYPFGSPDNQEDDDTLLCFDSQGNQLWKKKIGREVETTGGTPYPRNYTVYFLHVLRKPTPSGGQIVVGARRGGTSLFLVSLFTTDGEVVGEYYHPGWLWAVGSMDLDGDGVVGLPDLAILLASFGMMCP